MISYIEKTVANYELEGFEATLNGSSLFFDAGSFISDGTTIDFEAFTFDIEASPEYRVTYDIYLLANGSIHVDRTEGDMPAYEGTEPLLFLLSSFTTEPNETEHNVKINKVVKEQ